MPRIDAGGDRLNRQQFCREGPEGAGGQVVHESAVCPCSSESQLCRGLYKKEHTQQSKASDYFPLHSVCENTSEILCPVLGHPV